MYISSLIGGYCGPGEYGLEILRPDFEKRFDLPKDHIGLFFSFDKINLPKDVYDFFLICSSCSLTIIIII